ncbi:MAG: hypothetical protein WAX89_04340 [Alphaproteobacteria bacterium]
MQRLTHGWAADEAILIGAMMGSVGIFAAVAIPWDTALENMGFTELNDLAAIERANEKFYQTYGQWPTQASNGTPLGNAAVLTTGNAMADRTLRTRFKPMTERFPFDMSSGRPELRHSMGRGGRIWQETSDNPSYRMKVVFENVPYSQAAAMDKDIDNTSTEADFDTGRLQATVHDGVMNMVYYANPVASATAGR